MTDKLKPKRKRTPNRRRRLIILFLLFDLLIVGMIVLSPPIQGWLATDPFTAQCQFEEDRLFAYGQPTQLTSINKGQHSTFTTYDLPTSEGVRWSPYGHYMGYHAIDGKPVIYNVANPTKLIELPYPASLSYVISWGWSPNGRYIAFGALDDQGQSRQYFMQISGDDVDILEFNEGDPQIEYINSIWWSPDSKYAVVKSLDGWFIYDFEKLENLRLADIPNHASQVYWVSETTFYFAEDKMLYEYNAEEGHITPVTSLPYKNVTAMVIYHERFALFWTSDRGMFSYNLETNALLELDAQFQFWDDKMNRALYLDSLDNTLFWRDVETESISPITEYLTTLNDYSISTSQKYMLYASRNTIASLSSYPRYRLINREYRLLNLDSVTDQLLVTFDVPNNLFWIYIDGQDYIVMQKWITQTKGLYMTYLIEPDTMERCKVGITDIFLNGAIQPNPQSTP